MATRKPKKGVNAIISSATIQFISIRLFLYASLIVSSLIVLIRKLLIAIRDSS
ncbi:MAG: sortase B protein-sorting domain-containing protein [Prevotella sp.]|nr:sortase B protein-sorting domain-containing protein [Prevotella sp.]